MAVRLLEATGLQPGVGVHLGVTGQGGPETANQLLLLGDLIAEDTTRLSHRN